ncbi:unnamed protein product [Microthlaspi erraticum]|uniref:Uncharacterized protein n=1 Tax=Microthlaspi erraticum TaxID=1685480 RepID=A0A6D2HXS4_9BRAS|nr:unnamed protein product [Microthlaspi erraticum]
MVTTVTISSLTVTNYGYKLERHKNCDYIHHKAVRQVYVTEARLSHLAIPPSQFIHPPPVPPPMPALPSPPCGSNIGSQTLAQREESCRKVRRPPKTKRRKIQKPPAAIPLPPSKS